MGKRDRGEGAEARMDFGLGGILKGLGSLIDAVSELAEKGEELKERFGEVEGPGGTRLMYGVSVRMGPGGRPTVQRFGNVRETPQGPAVEEVREPMVDIFDEDEEVLVVAEMPGVEEAAIRAEVRDDILTISAAQGERKYSKEVLLPSPVRAGEMKICCKSGILEIRLPKRRVE